MSYAEFLAGKAPLAPDAGFAVDRRRLNPRSAGWQKDCVQWALARGRAALFEDTGMGKTLQQLDYGDNVAQESRKPFLVLTPLAVAGPTIREGEKFGIPARVVREASEVGEGINVCNYERLHLLDPSVFGGVSLDESSILKGFGSKTRWALNAAFERTPYRLCNSATPSPNQHTELGTQAHFLGVMDHGEMLTRWFSNDTTEARKLTLKPHGEAEFWRWVAGWAISISRPSDLLDRDGNPYPDEGYDLPPLNILEHVVRVEHAQENGELFASGRLSATEMHREMRRTARARAEEVADRVREKDGETWALWCNTNYEADELARLIPEAVEVRGSETIDAKERKLNDFSEGRIRVLVTKPTIAGFGLNWQHVGEHAFVGLSYSYEQLYQAIRRSWRYRREGPVNAHLICAETETGVLDAIHEKQAEQREMRSKMVAAMRETGMGRARDLRAEVGDGYFETVTGDSWTVHRGDAVEVAREKIPDGSVGLSVFSPPFSSLYSYSPSLRDMGNCSDDGEFFEHFSYLIPELLRVTIPGRLCVVHTKDLVRYKNRYGFGGVRDFTGEVTRAFEGCVLEDGTRWAYHSKVTIWKDPVREMQRTKSTGLLYKTLREDASRSRVGLPEYLVVFRKWTPGMSGPDGGTQSPDPVLHTREDYPLELWQRVASPVWDDIRQTNVLNANMARDGSDEKHLCPLQLDLIERCVELWSNPGDLVYDPFSGLGSTGVQAVKMGRRYVGSELKDTYFRQSLRHLARAEYRELTLDDALGAAG